MKTIDFKRYKTVHGDIGTAYYNDESCINLKAKNPYKAHRGYHIAVIDCCKFNAVKI